jgi:hypothetical protein
MKFIFVIILLFVTTDILSQISGNTIEVRKRELGGRFYVQNNKKLRVNDFRNILKDNNLAYQQLTFAYQNYYPAQILGFVGGYCIGRYLGASLTDNPFETKRLLIGGAIISAVSIGFKSAFKNRLARAVMLYNRSVQPTIGYVPTNRVQNIHVVLNNNGLGFGLNF